MKQKRSDKQSSNLYQLLLDNIQDIVMYVAADDRILEVNQAAVHAYGYTKAELLTMTLSELHFDNPQILHSLATPDNARRRVETAGRRKDGGGIHLEITFHNAYRMEEKIILCIGRDITEQKCHEQQWLATQKKVQALINALPDTLFRLGRDGLIKNCIIRPHTQYYQMIRSMIGKNVMEVFPKNTALKIIHSIERVLRTKKLATLEYKYPVEKGSLFFEARLVTSGDDEVQAIVRDISERKHMEQQLHYMSFHDALTGLYNRAYFEQEINRLKTVRRGGAGVVICDVDGLKLINDSFGHAAGDKVLKEVALMIKSAFRAGDMVARFGGDEFVALLPSPSARLCLNICKRLEKMIAQYNKETMGMPIGISIGYAVSESSTANIEDLLKEADHRMYRQKLHHHKSSKSAIVDALMKALQSRDYITEGHGDRLQQLVLLLAKAVGVSPEAFPDLCLFARFHDIGKVSIPDRILFKPARLTEKEYAVMKTHSEIGYRIALSIPDLTPIADWILLHHECWNGNGYPMGAEKNKIPVECRILAIADAFDAMTNDRPYRKAMGRKKALAEIQRCSGSQFDPDLVALFLHVV